MLTKEENKLFKHHFKACFATINSYFSWRERNCLLVHAKLTMNLLCLIQVNPKISAYTYLFSNVDYNKASLVPLRTKVIAHTNV